MVGYADLRKLVLLQCLRSRSFFCLFCLFVHVPIGNVSCDWVDVICLSEIIYNLV